MEDGKNFRDGKNNFREAHNLEVLGSNPSPATSQGSPQVIAAKGKTRCGVGAVRSCRFFGLGVHGIAPV